MTHGFSRNDWIEYTSGEIQGSRKEQLEAHLPECSACRETARQLAAVDETLAVLAGQLLKSQPVPDDAIRDAFRVWQLRSSQPASAEPQQLLWLELFLSHLFGHSTAKRAMRRAANQVAAESAETVTPYQWGGFVQNLSDVVGELCGEPAARLLQAIGCLTL